MTFLGFSIVFRTLLAAIAPHGAESFRKLPSVEALTKRCWQTQIALNSNHVCDDIQCANLLTAAFRFSIATLDVMSANAVKNQPENKSCMQGGYASDSEEHAMS